MCQKRSITKIELLNQSGYPAKVDDCIAEEIIEIQEKLDKENQATLHLKVVASCCGHGRYDKTIVIHNDCHPLEEYPHGLNYEYFTENIIPRIRNFYKMDKKKYYYIPEVSEEK